MCYLFAGEAPSNTKQSGSIQIVSAFVTFNSTKPMLLNPSTRNLFPRASSKMPGVPMPAASCKPVGLLATLTKSPTLNVADEVFTSNDPKLSDRGVRRGTCMVGGKAAAEAGAVTHGAVRCSAWLGDIRQTLVVVRLSKTPEMMDAVN